MTEPNIFHFDPSPRTISGFERQSFAYPSFIAIKAKEQLSPLVEQWKDVIKIGRTHTAAGSPVLGIVAIDIVPSRLEMAKELGETHAIISKQTNPVEAIRDITGGGVDYSLEASGDPRALHQAIEALRSLGTCGIVGAEPLGTEVSFDVNNLMISGKGIRGILEGESVPDIFIPQLIELNAQGRFPFEKLVKFYSLDQINQAAQDSEREGTIKPIIRLSTA